MNIFAKLITLADTLDSKGFVKEADEIDIIIEGGWSQMDDMSLPRKPLSDEPLNPELSKIIQQQINELKEADSHALEVAIAHEGLDGIDMIQRILSGVASLSGINK